MNIDEQRLKSRRVKDLISKGIYLQEAQRIADIEAVQRRKMADRLKGRTPITNNPEE